MKPKGSCQCNPPVDAPKLPDPRGTSRYRYATCIRVFQNGNKVMEFSSKSMVVSSADKEHITFYDDLGKHTTIYNNGGIIYVRYKDKQE